MSDYSLAMPFLDGSESFVHGYECGAMAEKMVRGEVFDGRLVHTENVEQLKMLGKMNHYTVSFEVLDDTWTRMTGRRTNAN